ncbi:MAG: bifunctional 2-polyprenyl-6-hydroxyphenol methylase/3-demethylubiquinol 3-O-methyltransferase UbiG [Pseudomonadota bacterium]
MIDARNQPEVAPNLSETANHHEKTGSASGETVDPAEVEKFSQIAAEWWDPLGKFKPLHKFNPVRLGFIRDTICMHFGRDRLAKSPLEGLRLLDVGCGGGLISEPMRRLGAAVTGLDASERNIAVARLHAADMKLDIDYRCASVESLVSDGEAPFDIVLNLEAVEHVANVDLFVEASAKLVKPGGMMIVATINRTLKAFALAKVGAEYVLGWLPRGTHDPRRFVKPEEIARPLGAAGLTVTGTTGVFYNPLVDSWRISDDPSVNYMVVAERTGDNQQ